MRQPLPTLRQRIGHPHPHQSTGWEGRVSGLGRRGGARSTWPPPRGIPGPRVALLTLGLAVSLSLSPHLTSAQDAQASHGWSGLIAGKGRGRSKSSSWSMRLGAQHLVGVGGRVELRWKRDTQRERERREEREKEKEGKRERSRDA